eukprot:1092754-Prymnesium_polylepis.1
MRRLHRHARARLTIRLLSPVRHLARRLRLPRPSDPFCHRAHRACGGLVRRVLLLARPARRMPSICGLRRRPP